MSAMLRVGLLVTVLALPACAQRQDPEYWSYIAKKSGEVASTDQR
jgi:hypothetical protein